MDVYDIFFQDSRETVNKGFNIKDKDKAIRMAKDMLKERKGYVNQFPGGNISVQEKETGEVIWQDVIPEEK